jgi:hypothetical protein
MDTVRRQNKKGVVLIITLWIIVVLAVVSLAMVRQINMEVKMVGFQRDITTVDSLALAGLRQAIIVLREDQLKDSGEDIQQTLFRFGDDDIYPYDGGTEHWADYPDVFEEVPFYENGGKTGYYYVDIVDESAKLPINQAKPESIAHLIELTGVDEDEAFEIAAAIADFRDSDDLPFAVNPGFTSGGGGRSSQNRGGGKGRDATDETSYYNGRTSRNDNTMPEYVMKNAGIGTMDELLFIPGITPEILFGTVDPNEEGSRRRSRGKRGSGSYLGLVNYMSVYTSATNLNTVKQEVLESILYPFLAEKAKRISEDWTKYRDGGDGETYTRDDRVLKTIDNTDMDNVDISRVNGMSEELLSQTQILSIQTNVFEVKAFGEYQGIKKGYKAIIQRDFKSWDQIPEFGVDIFDLSQLEQVTIQVILFEPLYDAKKQMKDK